MRTESRVRPVKSEQQYNRTALINTEEWPARESPLRSRSCLPEAAAATNLRERGNDVVQDMAYKEAGGALQAGLDLQAAGVRNRVWTLGSGLCTSNRD